MFTQHGCLTQSPHGAFDNIFGINRAGGTGSGTSNTSSTNNVSNNKSSASSTNQLQQQQLASKSATSTTSADDATPRDPLVAPMRHLIATLLETLTCPMCQMTFLKPVQTVFCAHVICAPCMGAALNNLPSPRLSAMLYLHHEFNTAEGTTKQNPLLLHHEFGAEYIAVKTPSPKRKRPGPTRRKRKDALHEDDSDADEEDTRQNSNSISKSQLESDQDADDANNDEKQLLALRDLMLSDEGKHWKKPAFSKLSSCRNFSIHQLTTDPLEALRRQFNVRGLSVAAADGSAGKEDLEEMIKMSKLKQPYCQPNDDGRQAGDDDDHGGKKLVGILDLFLLHRAEEDLRLSASTDTNAAATGSNELMLRRSTGSHEGSLVSSVAGSPVTPMERGSGAGAVSSHFEQQNHKQQQQQPPASKKSSAVNSTHSSSRRTHNRKRKENLCPICECDCHKDGTLTVPALEKFAREFSGLCRDNEVFAEFVRVKEAERVVAEEKEAVAAAESAPKNSGKKKTKKSSTSAAEIADRDKTPRVDLRTLFESSAALDLRGTAARLDFGGDKDDDDDDDDDQQQRGGGQQQLEHASSSFRTTGSTNFSDSIRSVSSVDPMTLSRVQSMVMQQQQSSSSGSGSGTLSRKETSSGSSILQPTQRQ